MRIDPTNEIDLMGLETAELRTVQTTVEHVLALRGQPVPSPLLKVIFDALTIRGWEMPGDGTFVDPEGNIWRTVEDAVSAQTFREIGRS